jgi:hypothetical protein
MKSLLQNRFAAGEATLVGVVVATLVAIIIGVMVWYNINKNIFSNFGFPAVHTTATTSQNATQVVLANVNTTANTIWTLFPIVAIVIIAGIILAIVTNFGRGPTA